MYEKDGVPLCFVGSGCHFRVAEATAKNTKIIHLFQAGTIATWFKPIRLPPSDRPCPVQSPPPST